MPTINSSTSYQSPVAATQTIPNYGSVDGALILMILTSSSSAGPAIAAIEAAFSSGGYTNIGSSTGGGPSYSAVYAKIYRTATPGSNISFDAGTNVTVGVTQIQVTGWYGAISGVNAQVGTAAAVSTSIDPASHVAGWGSANNMWIAVAARSNTLANNPLTSNPTGYTSVLSHGPALTSGASQWVYYKSATATSDDPSQFAWSNARAATAYTILIRPSAVQYLRVYLHDSAAGATGIAGAVFLAPAGADITGTKVGEFTGLSFETALENNLAVLKVPLSSFNGQFLTLADTPVVVVRNGFDTSGIVTASIIEA
jgi:hypothetical protein